MSFTRAIANYNFEVKSNCIMSYGTFITLVNNIPNALMLELGTKRSNPANKTEHSDRFNHYQKYIKTDIEDGIDVDFVCDAHQLSKYFSELDAVISCSTFEHFRRPWIVASEIGKILKPEGLVFVQTHQTYPLHAYPYDYFRFSTEALSGIFEDAGFNVLKAEYEFPANIHSARVPNSYKCPAWLNVCLLAQKMR